MEIVADDDAEPMGVRPLRDRSLAFQEFFTEEFHFKRLLCGLGLRLRVLPSGLPGLAHRFFDLFRLPFPNAQPLLEVRFEVGLQGHAGRKLHHVSTGQLQTVGNEFTRSSKLRRE